MSAVELRSAFALQVVGMMLNNISLLLVWIFFFQAFGPINHWSALETVGLQGIATLAYGLTFAFTAGMVFLPDFVNNGTFDTLILSPRNLYLRVVTSRMIVPAIGDMVYGFILILLYLIGAGGSWLAIIILLTLLPAITLIFMNVTLVVHLVAFLFPDASALAKNLFELFVTPALYPSALYQGALRIIFLWIIPALAVAGFPIEVVRDLSWRGYALIWGLAFFWTALGVVLLNLAVRRYESGNLTGARV